jgi:hypothetical protein
LAKDNAAYSYLHEAITQAQLLGMQDEETYRHNPLNASRKRVLCWMLFVTERYYRHEKLRHFTAHLAHRTYAIHKHWPFTLSPTIQTPFLGEVPSDRPIGVGLKLMINLYKIIDDGFVNLWNRVHDDVNSSEMARLHKQLSETVPLHLECTGVQALRFA